MNLYEKLIDKMKAYPMHMPGHKRNKEFVMCNPYEIDVTEIKGTDNLHHPKGMIRDLMNEMKEFYQTRETYLLVNGSTCGILAAISACCKRGDSILLARNCHRSVYNAIYLLDLKPVYLYTEQDENTGISLSVDALQVKEALRSFSPSCVILTSPTYEGIVSDIKGIAYETHKKNIPLIVDEAHGAHFAWSTFFPDSAIRQGADIVVESLHKTLPAFTQTAVLHICSERIKKELVERYLDIYETISPSYILIAGIAQCFSWMREQGMKRYLQYEKNVKWFWKESKKWKTLTLWRHPLQEPSKLVIFSKYLSGYELAEVLRKKYNIEIEMAGMNYILAMTSICDTEEGFQRLSDAIGEIDRQFVGLEPKEIFVFPPKEAIVCMGAYEAMNRQFDIEKLECSEGKISAEYAFIYPPGIPFLVPGEKITSYVIKKIQLAVQNKLELLGLADAEGKRIRIVQEGNRRDIEMGKLFVFMGKSASGKDTLFSKTVAKHPELNLVVPYTTRPIRAGETEGKEYHFVTEATMNQIEKDGKMVECRCYDTIQGPWYYFTAEDGQMDFSKGSYCLISTLEGYEKIRDFYGSEKVIPIYIEVSDETRILRSLKREQEQESPCVAEVCRRFLADEEDFSEKKLQEIGIGMRVKNENLAEAFSQIERILTNNCR